ncbi:peptide-binding protein [Streptomyces sp. 150FB]|uniref:ABC transporter substrate-binding protein n=1 Tax=Streptomyces sp. 150FB TaxID=1576605 RepID=UPI00058964E7|nr:ABC transporter substrate-binding protein [Streptomyces sp. 150FB]KIF73700.1 peptide-binding protein [Streptomyces sp. 150FB]
MNRKTLVLSAVVAVLASVLAGCGGPGSGSDSSDVIVVGTTDPFVATAKAPAPVDPAYTYDTNTWNLLRQTIQSLLYIPRGGGAPEPDAASECGFTDTSSESYRCTLRSGLKFASGDPVTAADVKYSIERVLNISDPNGAVGLLSNIDTIDVKGDTGLVFHLKTADATFPYKLSTPIAGIIDPKLYAPKKERNGFAIDGSGPYTFQAEVTNGQMMTATYTKNPTYKGALKVANDKVEMKYFPSAEKMMAALKKGDIDVMNRSITPQQIRDMQVKPIDGINLTELPGQEIRYLAFNTNAPVVKEKAVRQAMAASIDRGDLISKVYDGVADPLYSVIPAGISGHTNSFFNKYGQPSAAKAKQLLQNAGINTPVKLTLNYTTDHYGAATAKEFANLRDQLNATGLFDISLNGEKWATFLPKKNTGKYPVFGLGWFPDFPDPDNYIAPFLDKDNILHTPYVSEEAQKELIPASRREADRSAASDTFATLQDIVADDVPMLPLWQGKQYIAARDDITGAEWALDSGATLHLWELGRGTS